jgi:hypothetical protein
VVEIHADNGISDSESHPQSQFGHPIDERPFGGRVRFAIESMRPIAFRNYLRWRFRRSIQ